MKKYRILYIISYAILIFSLLVFILSLSFNRDYFSAISAGSLPAYEGTQFVALLYMLILGLLLNFRLIPGLEPLWKLLLALPFGCGLWSICSLIILMADLPYNFTTSTSFCLVVIILIETLRQIIAKNRYSEDSAGSGASGANLSTANSNKNKASKTGSGTSDYKNGSVNPVPALDSPFFPLLIILVAAALIFASGLVYSFVSYDSFYYFINYGHALANTGSYRAILGDNAYTITNIGQFLPLLCSYMSFWGIDQPYSLQAFLSLDILLLFGFGLHRLLPGDDGRVRIVYSIVFTLLLATSTSYIIITGWMLANMYCLIYITVSVLFMMLYSAGCVGFGQLSVVEALCFLNLTLIRKDGIVFGAFLFVCLVQLLSGDAARHKTALIYLPAVVAEIIWLAYVRLFLSAAVSQSQPQSIANNKNVLFVLIIIGGSYLYLFVFHELLLRLENKISLPPVNHYSIILAAMVLMLILPAIKKGGVVIDNIDFTIRNIFKYPSAWGLSGFIFAILLVMALAKSPIVDWGHFLWMGYLLMNLVSYSLVDSKDLWVNWDDSYSRVLLQLVPAFLLIMGEKIYSLKPAASDNT